MMKTHCWPSKALVSQLEQHWHFWRKPSYAILDNLIAVELSLSEQLLQWRNVNLFVSTLQQWPGLFFFFFFKREGKSKHLDETDVYSSHLWWYSSLWWTDGVLHRLVLSNRSLKTLHTLVAIWIIGSISSLEQIRLDDALDLRCLCI